VLSQAATTSGDRDDVHAACTQGTAPLATIVIPASSKDSATAAVHVSATAPVAGNASDNIATGSVRPVGEHN
jgi:hypothetical protein